MSIKLTTENGQRKYLNSAERTALIRAVKQVAPVNRTLCLMLVHTGCLISEAIGLRYGDIDLSGQKVSIRTLRKRNKESTATRTVPLPSHFLIDLVYAHKLGRQNTLSPDTRLWGWSRTSAFRKVKEAMKIAGIEGYHATPLGIRHGFGMYCAEKEVPLNYIRKWMGHSSLEITEMYLLNRVCDERAVAERLWH
ncbi:MAG: site-specific integrase [Bacteroidota bacterium]